MSEDILMNKENIPLHIAIIMDGNGRWAEKKGENRTIGHENGAFTVRKIIEAASEIGTKYLTLYTFSTENWNRPKSEIRSLMSILITFLNQELETLINNNIRLLTIGSTTSLPVAVQKHLIALSNSLPKTPDFLLFWR